LSYTGLNRAPGLGHSAHPLFWPGV